MAVTKRTALLVALAGIVLPAACGGSTDSFGISGTLVGTCASGVTVTATVEATGTVSATAASDATGKYELTGLPNGTYKVTPSKAGCTFNPPALSVTIDGKVAAANDFIANAS